jgi:hypothetical protein
MKKKHKFDMEKDKRRFEERLNTERTILGLDGSNFGILAKSGTNLTVNGSKFDLEAMEK